MADFSSIPRDLVVKILSHLGTTEEVIKCSYLSHELQGVTNEPALWQELANIKYGEAITNATIDLYQGDWKEMLMDDNRRGAIPTLVTYKPCLWKYNNSPWTQWRMYRRSGLFYCCIITGIQWNRAENRIRVYFDARGEHDLRQARMSSIRVSSEDGSSLSTFRSIDEKLFVQREGHYKGYLDFPQLDLDQEDVCNFCYANMLQNRADYEAIPLIEGKLNANMFDRYTLKDETLFENETHETEMARWQKVLPEGFLDKRPEWWV